MNEASDFTFLIQGNCVDGETNKMGPRGAIEAVERHKILWAERFGTWEEG